MTTTALPHIAKITELLGGDVAGGEVLCPGPGHSDDDRSLSVKPDPADREGFLTHSFAKDDWKDCRDHVRRRLDLSDPEPQKQKKASGDQKIPGRKRQKEVRAISLGRRRLGEGKTQEPEGPLSAPRTDRGSEDDNALFRRGRKRRG